MVLKITNLHILKYLPTCWLYLLECYTIDNQRCTHTASAVVAPHTERLPHFFPLIKQHGALLAKGRLLGIQFETLFTDGLYLEMGKHAVRLAQKLKQGFVQKGYKLHMDSPTNQQFVCLPNADIDRLSAHATFELWGPRGEEETVVRFVTSWATREADVDALIDLL